jgi:hypothetical protein
MLENKGNSFWENLVILVLIKPLIFRIFFRFANCTVYVGLSYYGPALGENPHLSFFLSSAVELPGYLLCWLLMDRWGRRWPFSLAMLLGGVFDIATVLLPSGKGKRMI